MPHLSAAAGRQRIHTHLLSSPYCVRQALACYTSGMLPIQRPALHVPGESLATVGARGVEGATGTSREALEDKAWGRRGGGGGSGCVPPKPVSSLLLFRGLSREPCPKSLAPGGRLSIVKRWPLQAGPPAATAAASCPPSPFPPQHTHTHTRPACIPSTFSTMTMLPTATGQQRALKRM